MPMWRRSAPRRLSPQATWLSGFCPCGLLDAAEFLVVSAGTETLPIAKVLHCSSVTGCQYVQKLKGRGWVLEPG